MKIGITGFIQLGDEQYKKMKEYGFDSVDFGMADTDSAYYTLPEEESDALLLRHKALAEEAGVVINKVHGPWRYPPEDDTEENRAERFEKMSRSIRMTALLGCKYWVIHPIMPFGTHDIEEGKEKETWELNVEFFKKLLPVAKEYGVTI
jgi:sugar phosphate isomerase/epimerase